MQPKVNLDFSCSVRVIVVMGTRVAVVMGKPTVDTRAALEAVAQHRPNAMVADKMPANTRQADEVAGNRAYTAQVVAAQSTAHGCSLYFC